MGKVHSRRARPTLRLLREDLAGGWDDPRPLRHLEHGDLERLHPLSALEHPLVAKARDSFDEDASADQHHGAIASCQQLRLLEIKARQWRGGVWHDSERGVNWLVVAGLAKGGHMDRDDFYQQVAREDRAGTADRWLPTVDDVRLLQRETAFRLVTEWELALQEQAASALGEVANGGTVRFEVRHPVPDRGRVASVTVEVAPVRDDDYKSDDLVVEIVADRGVAGADLIWQLTTRILVTLNPPVQAWDRYDDTFSTIAEPGTWGARGQVLTALVRDRELAEAEPGAHAHYSHRQHLADYTVDGNAVRALCGVFFVPMQDHDALPTCPSCSERLAERPA